MEKAAAKRGVVLQTVKGAAPRRCSALAAPDPLHAWHERARSRAARATRASRRAHTHRTRRGSPAHAPLLPHAATRNASHASFRARRPRLTRLTLLICADIVELLIGDDLVCMDKIGTSNFYWSLTSEHANKARGAQHKKRSLRGLC
jgi:hypothetical protein